MSSDNVGGSGPFVRSPAELESLRAQLRLVSAAGYRLFPLVRGSKVPRDRGWQTKEYSINELKRWARLGGNFGIALGDDDLILDVDPRSGGFESIEQLEDELGLDLAAAPRVLSGRCDGGYHAYFKKPSGTRIVGKLERYPGIDLKSRGGLVVAPGSRHPVTVRMYRHDPKSPPFTEVKTAPSELLDLLTRRAPVRKRGFGGGELTVDQLERLLSVLDPQDFGAGHYERWIRLASACHDATNGEGLDVWLDWAAGDPGYGPEADEQNRRTWESFTAGKPGGATYLTLLREVASAGRPDLARELEPGLVFDDARPDLDFSSSTRRLDGVNFREIK